MHNGDAVCMFLEGGEFFAARMFPNACGSHVFEKCEEKKESTNNSIQSCVLYMVRQSPTKYLIHACVIRGQAKPDQLFNPYMRQMWSGKARPII